MAEKTPEQLTFDLGHEPVEDDLGDLDREHAERVLAEEEKAAARPRACCCKRRSAYTITASGKLVCFKCGRTW